MNLRLYFSALSCWSALAILPHARARAQALPSSAVIDSLIAAEAWAQAVPLLDRRLSETPTSTLYAQRGRAYRELGDFARARRDYDSALTLDSTFSGAYAGRAATRFYDQDPQGALEDVARARRFGLNVPPLTLLEGMAYDKQGNGSASYAAFDRYVNDAPSDPVGWYYRGYAAGRAGRHEVAVKDLTRAIALRMQGPNAYRFRALSLLAMGNLSDACTDGAAAARLGDKEAEALVAEHCR